MELDEADTVWGQRLSRAGSSLGRRIGTQVGEVGVGW